MKPLIRGKTIHVKQLDLGISHSPLLSASFSPSQPASLFRFWSLYEWIITVTLPAGLWDFCLLWVSLSCTVLPHEPSLKSIFFIVLVTFSYLQVEATWETTVVRSSTDDSFPKLNSKRIPVITLQNHFPFYLFFYRTHYSYEALKVWPSLQMNSTLTH